MKSITIVAGCSLAAASFALAQIPAGASSDRTLLNAQAEEIFEALRPAVAKAVPATVEIRVSRKRIGFGTVVKEGRVLAKWSDVKPHLRTLACRTAEDRWLPASVEGIYREADLALLKVDGLKAQPLVFDDPPDLKLGSFLALARPDGEAASMGVVSVLPRSLRESDRAFLGIEMDLAYQGRGVRVKVVQRDTGAASAGLRSGDIITSVLGQEVNGNFELSTVLQRLEPGQKIRIDYRRGEDQKVASVTLGGRPVDPLRIPYRRMELMNNMGGHHYSEVRDGFRDVIQSDMQIEPEDCGAPVVDLDGRVVGIAVARAGRIKSFIMPAAAVKNLLASDPAQPQIEELAVRAAPVPESEDEFEDPFEVMRRKMDEMRRLMEEIEEKGR